MIPAFIYHDVDTESIDEAMEAISETHLPVTDEDLEEIYSSDEETTPIDPSIDAIGDAMINGHLTADEAMDMILATSNEDLAEAAVIEPHEPIAMDLPTLSKSYYAALEDDDSSDDESCPSLMERPIYDSSDDEDDEDDDDSCPSLAIGLNDYNSSDEERSCPPFRRRPYLDSSDDESDDESSDKGSCPLAMHRSHLDIDSSDDETEDGNTQLMFDVPSTTRTIDLEKLHRI
mgnify:CR=1 FL=1